MRKLFCSDLAIGEKLGLRCNTTVKRTAGFLVWLISFLLCEPFCSKLSCEENSWTLAFCIVLERAVSVLDLAVRRNS